MCWLCLWTASPTFNLLWVGSLSWRRGLPSSDLEIFSNLHNVHVFFSGTLSDMDGKMFQLVLTLVRNLLAVDDAFSPLIRASTSSNAHAAYFKDELLERLFKENVIDLLLALTPHVSGEQPFLRQDNLLILEIFNYLFSGQLPDIIASSADKTQEVCMQPAITQDLNFSLFWTPILML